MKKMIALMAAALVTLSFSFAVAAEPKKEAAAPAAPAAEKKEAKKEKKAPAKKEAKPAKGKKEMAGC